MACWMFQVFKRLAGFISWVLAANLRGLARLYFEDMLTDFHYLKKFWRNESCPATVWLLHWLWISYFNREILLNAFGHDFKSHLPDAFPFLMAQLCLQTLKSRLACDVMFKVASCILRANSSFSSQLSMSCFGEKHNIQVNEWTNLQLWFISQTLFVPHNIILLQDRWGHFSCRRCFSIFCQFKQNQLWVNQLCQYDQTIPL